jgi:hypothetical protein
MKSLALIAALSFGAALAQAPAQPSQLEERAKQLAKGYEQILPMPFGPYGTVVLVDSDGTSITLRANLKMALGDFDQSGERSLAQFMCNVPTPTTDFIADGGTVKWGLRFSDGEFRMVALTKANCNPPRSAPATREELAAMVASIEPTLPFTRPDGTIVKDVSLGEGLRLTYTYALDNVVPIERVPLLRGDIDFAIRMGRLMKEKVCTDPAIRLMLNRGVTYEYLYMAHASKVFEATITKEYCGLS